MVILDTNVVTETLSQRPSASVKAWLVAQPLASIFTTAVTEPAI